jgi:hypothetical protein
MRMRRSIPLQPRVLAASLLATALSAALASACPDPKTPGVSAATPNLESDAVLLAAASNCPEQAEATTAVAPAGLARFRDGDHKVPDRSLNWLLIGPAPRVTARVATEKMARATERKSGSGSETLKPARDPVSKRGGVKRGGIMPVGRPHRMPSPEIL